MRFISVLFSCVIFAGCYAQPCAVKLDLSKAIIINEYRTGDPNALIDEQLIAGDPINKKGGSPNTLWFPGGAKSRL